jgi:hypothetical protein
MNKIAKFTAISVVAAATGLAAVNANAGRYDDGRYCDRAEQRGGPDAMTKHKGQRGPVADRDLDLTAEEAKTLVEARLIMDGNDRLKTGQVAEKDQETYLVDIVTVDNSLVRQVEVDRDNGLPRGSFGRRR